MKALFVVREAGSRKVVAGPVETKKEAKALRDQLDPDAAQMSKDDIVGRQQAFKFVVSYGQDHILFGRKNTYKHSTRKTKK